MRGKGDRIHPEKNDGAILKKGGMEMLKRKKVLFRI